MCARRYDHYYTHQGMPCVNGEPQEFQFQDEQTRWQKKVLPKSKVLQYRITDAVPYAKVNKLSLLFACFFVVVA